jgi:hypothetical protein
MRQVLLSDSFSSAFASNTWSSTSGVTASNICGFLSDKAALFNSAGPRELTSHPLDTSGGALISFHLMFGDGMSATPEGTVSTPSCGGISAGEEVNLQYSVNNGVSWVTFKEYFTSDSKSPYTRFTLIEETLPPGGQSTSTIIRWIQPSHGMYSIWALEDVKIVGSTTYTYDISSLVPGTSYYATVYAVNSEGYSPGTNSSSAQKPASVPGAPPSASVLVRDKTSVTFDFAKISCNNPAINDCNGQPVVLYTIEWSTSSTFVSLSGSYNITSETHNIAGDGPFTTALNGLTTGQEYFFRVRGYNVEGYGDFRKSSPESVVPAVPPDALASASLHLNDKTSLKVKFNTIRCLSPAVDPCNGQPVSKYKVQYSQSSNFHVGLKSIEINAASSSSVAEMTVQINNLVSSHQYFVRIAGHNREGYGDIKASSPPFLTASEVASAPAVVTFSARNSTSLSVVWTEAVDNGRPIVQYKLEWSALVDYSNSKSEIIYRDEAFPPKWELKGPFSTFPISTVFADISEAENLRLSFDMKCSSANAGSHRGIIDKMVVENGEHVGFKVGFQSGGQLSTSVGNLTTVHPAVVADDAWHSIEVVYDGTGLYINVDGATSSSFVHLSGAAFTNFANLTIGTDLSVPGRNFIGELRNFQLRYDNGKISRTSRIVSDLVTGTPYYARVSAANQLEYQSLAYSTTTSAVEDDNTPQYAVPATVPDPPPSISLFVSSRSSITVTVSNVPCGNPATDPCRGRPVTQFKIEWSNSSTFAGQNVYLRHNFTAIKSSDVNATYEIQFLTSGTKYYVRAYAANTEGFGAVSTNVGVNVVDATPIGDGRSQVMATESCARLLNDFPGKTTGLYWVLPGGGFDTSNAFQVYCDMTKKCNTADSNDCQDGGWALVTKVYDKTYSDSNGNYVHLDNHKTHKFTGVVYFNDNVGVSAGEVKPDQNHILQPWSIESSRWGSYDPSQFTFSQMIINYKIPKPDSVLFNINNEEWSKFPRNVAGMTGDSWCVMNNRAGNWYKPCHGATNIYRAGDNENFMVDSFGVPGYLGGYCTTVPDNAYKSKFQSLCVAEGTSRARGYNFISAETSVELGMDPELKETCRPNGNCGHGEGRQFEIWVR